jgi:hypothetical protein
VDQAWAGEKFHSTASSYYLIVEAMDGYRAVFAWAELDSTFIEKAVYVVTKRDGKPLPEKDGPFQLIAPVRREAHGGFGRWRLSASGRRIEASTEGRRVAGGHRGVLGE